MIKPAVDTLVVKLDFCLLFFSTKSSFSKSIFFKPEFCLRCYSVEGIISFRVVLREAFYGYFSTG